MTIVHFGLRHPGAAGRVQATGRVAWIPTERKVDGSLVVLPSRVSVTLTPEASAEIEPGTYLFHEEAVGGISAYRIVPNAIEVEYASLVAVDPATLDPEAQPEAAWYAFVESLNASNADMLASALSAQHSAELAQLSATGSQTSAAASAQLSAGSALASSNSATASANSATQAGTARDGAVSAQASAAGHASAASGYRDVAAEYADEAAEQAGLALVRAGTATDKAAEATAAVLGFGIGTVSTVGPSEAAAATVTGPVGNRVLNLTLPRGATPVFSVLETTTGPETPGATGLKGDTGTKGDPGGFVLGTALDNAVDTGVGRFNLNDVLTSGIYRMTATNDNLLARNYPRNYDTGILEVFERVPGQTVIQVWHSLNINGRIKFERCYVNGWQPWYAYSSQKVNQTVGRTISTWNDANLQDQMIYGDTGERDIAVSHGNGTFAALKLRRVGSLVELTAVGWQYVAGNMLAVSLPAGYRNNNTKQATALRMDTLAVLGVNIPANSGNPLVYGSPPAGTLINFSASWLTIDNWPSSLLGSASGTIPYL